MAAAKVRIQLGPILNTLAPLGVAILILVGGRAVIHGDIDVGHYAEFSALLARLVWPTLTLGFMLALVQRGRASWSRPFPSTATVGRWRSPPGALMAIGSLHDPLE